MHKKSLLILALAAACCTAQAQSTPAKKDLVARILKIQQAGIEMMATQLAEEPALELGARAANVLAARVPPEKREAVGKEIDGDLRKYADEAVPLVRERAVRLAPTTVGAVLEQKFSEDELKQVLAMLESPVYVKFQGLGADMQKALTEKLIADTRPAIEPKVRTLEQSIARRLGVPVGQADSAPAAASKPAAKK